MRNYIFSNSIKFVVNTPIANPSLLTSAVAVLTFMFMACPTASAEEPHLAEMHTFESFVEDEEEENNEVTPPPPGGSCEYYDIRTRLTGKGVFAINGNMKTVKTDEARLAADDFDLWIENKGPDLECLDQIKEDIYAKCLPTKDKTNMIFLNSMLGCLEKELVSLFYVSGEQASLYGGLYFNADCEGVAQPTTGTVCDGMVMYHISPISLLWEDGVDIEAETTFSNFPLDPTHPGKSYVWKASAQAPLLVFDPTHEGRIISATQLFGDWTFGGKRDALGGVAMDLNSEPELGEKWDNGFEPLALLDLNADGEISGEELKPLGLWFDHNRDGISQSGEVQSLDTAGVTALFYKPDFQDEKTRSIFANVGFRRVQDGKTLSGRSVDWYGAGASNSLEIINRSNITKDLCS